MPAAMDHASAVRSTRPAGPQATCPRRFRPATSGGSLTISSEMGKGTIVSAFVPLSDVLCLLADDGDRTSSGRMVPSIFLDNRA